MCFICVRLLERYRWKLLQVVSLDIILPTDGVFLIHQKNSCSFLFLFSFSAVDGIITSSVEDVVNAICQEDFKVGSSEKDNTIESNAGVSVKENTVESNGLIM